MPESSYRDAFGRVTGQIGRFAGTIGSAIASAFTTRGSDAANATTSGYVMREERPTTAPGYEEVRP